MGAKSVNSGDYLGKCALFSLVVHHFLSYGHYSL